MDIAFFLLLGVVGARAFIHFARRWPARTQEIFGAGLIVAALIYVGFGWQAPRPSPWLAIELVGMLAYGTFGVLGLKGSSLWLAAGWALHPLWDLALHYAGPGAHLAPAWYAIACLSFDVIVAFDIAFRRSPVLTRA